MLLYVGLDVQYAVTKMSRDANHCGYHGIALNMFWATSNHARYNAVKAVVNSRMKDGSKPYYTYD